MVFHPLGLFLALAVQQNGVPRSVSTCTTYILPFKNEIHPDIAAYKQSLMLFLVIEINGNCKFPDSEQWKDKVQLFTLFNVSTLQRVLSTEDTKPAQFPLQLPECSTPSLPHNLKQIYTFHDISYVHCSVTTLLEA